MRLHGDRLAGPLQRTTSVFVCGRYIGCRPEGAELDLRYVPEHRSSSIRCACLFGPFYMALFVQLQEQRCLQSWLVPSGTELTFPATQHPISGIYSVFDIADLLLSVSSVCSMFLKISPAYLARRSVLCSKRSHCPWLEQVQQQRGPMEETKGALLPPNRQLTSRSLMRL